MTQIKRFAKVFKMTVILYKLSFTDKYTLCSMVNYCQETGDWGRKREHLKNIKE